MYICKQYMLFVELINNIIMGKSTKEKLIIEAFKLFASKPYDQVTFADLEKVTNLSRGAILYHVKTKENLFNEVIHYFIFHMATASSLQDRDEMTLKEFIIACLSECDKERKEMAEIGILNINIAKLNIESQGFYFYPQMKENAEKWIENQFNAWTQVLARAIAKGEIKPVADVSDIASLFINLYLGISYSGIIREDGIDLKRLEKDIFFIYNMLKN